MLRRIFLLLPFGLGLSKVGKKESKDDPCKWDEELRKVYIDLMNWKKDCESRRERSLMAKIDILIGTVTRMVEESGVHFWAIYPTTYSSSDSPTICVSMTKTKKQRTTNWESDFQIVKAQFSFELDTPTEDIRIRLDQAVRSMDELAEKDGLEFADSPRQWRRQSWESVL